MWHRHKWVKIRLTGGKQENLILITVTITHPCLWDYFDLCFCLALSFPLWTHHFFFFFYCSGLPSSIFTHQPLLLISDSYLLWTYSITQGWKKNTVTDFPGSPWEVPPLQCSFSDMLLQVRMVINYLEINFHLGLFPPHPLTPPSSTDKISNYVQGKMEQGQSKAPSSEAAAPGCVQAAWA